MREKKKFASGMALALALATLVTPSVFAESRPANETRVRRESGGRIQRERSADRSETRRRDVSQNRERSDRREAVREESRSRSRRDDRRVDRNRSRDDHRDNRRNDRTWRGDSRSSQHRTYHNRQPYYAQGRVSRVHRYGSGYRVWVVGAPYPFFVPSRYYHRDRFRVGLTIHLGGYYNPLGYYDYYDNRYDRSYSSGDLRGTVESVDYRRDTFVVRNDATGSFVTVVMRDRRRDVRAGDYVELEGTWSRSGVFQAYDVDIY